uniref:Uncharacterized protein n=1 Tax=viral metagenome TaxID=1070528 RepID=A0A6C0KAA7_9ZZZZ
MKLVYYLYIMERLGEQNLILQDILKKQDEAIQKRLGDLQKKD